MHTHNQIIRTNETQYLPALSLSQSTVHTVQNTRH